MCYTVQCVLNSVCSYDADEKRWRERERERERKKEREREKENNIHTHTHREKESIDGHNLKVLVLRRGE